METLRLTLGLPVDVRNITKIIRMAVAEDNAIPGQRTEDVGCSSSLSVKATGLAIRCGDFSILDLLVRARTWRVGSRTRTHVNFGFDRFKLGGSPRDFYLEDSSEILQFKWYRFYLIILALLVKDESSNETK